MRCTRIGFLNHSSSPGKPPSISSSDGFICVVTSSRSELIHTSHVYISLCIFCALDSSNTASADFFNFLLNPADQGLKVNLLHQFDGQIDEFFILLVQGMRMSFEAPKGHLCVDDDEEWVKTVCRRASSGTG